MSNEIEMTRAGDEKGYVFISYSSKNKDTVLNDYLIPLQRDYGLRIYYDKDFRYNASKKWTEQMVRNLSGARFCLLFVSADYMFSYACLLEILNAIANGITILAIYLDSREKIDQSITGVFTGRETVAGDIQDINMSPDTKDAFDNVFSLLEYKNKYNEQMSRLRRDIEKENITKRKICVPMYKFINDNAGVSLKHGSKDIIKEIVSSIKNEIGKLDMFESTSEKNSVTETVQQEKFKPDTKTSASENPLERVQPTPSENASTQKGFNFSIYGQKHTGNQNYFIKTVFEQVMRKHEDLVPQLIDKIRCLSSTNYFDKNDTDNYKSKNPFITGEFYDIAGGVSVGTALNKKDKATYIAKLLIYCKEPLDIVECEDEEFYLMIKNTFDKKSGNLR